MSKCFEEKAITFHKVTTFGHDDESIECVSFEIREDDNTIVSGADTLENAIEVYSISYERRKS
jgi:hypothetical protein